MDTPNRTIQYCAAVCSSLAFVYIGAVLSWPSPALPKFKNGETAVAITDAQASWIVSLATVGAFPGCFLSQNLIDRIGTKKTLYVSALPGLTGASILIFSTVAELLYIARFLGGISTGMIAVVVMIYITEISDKEIRGALGMLVQVMNNLGSLLIYGIGPFVSYTVLNCIILSVPIVYIAVCLWIPESPYYYLKKGRFRDARREFVKLKGSKDEKWVDEQLTVIRAYVRESMENKTTMKELFTNMQYRKAVYIIAGLKLLQYMTGVVAIQSYLEMIFRQSSSISGPHASIVYGFVQLFAGITATFLPVYFGKRILMLVSSLGSAISMTIVGIYFFMQDYLAADESTLQKISALPLAGILAFNILYTIGIGNLPYVMQAELFPVNVKAVASSAATMSACVFSFVVAKGYQSVKDMFGHYTVFWIFAFVAYCGVFFIYFYVPETKGKTLEQVQDDMKIEKVEIDREEERFIEEKEMVKM